MINRGAVSDVLMIYVGWRGMTSFTKKGARPCLPAEDKLSENSEWDRDSTTYTQQMIYKITTI